MNCPKCNSPVEENSRFCPNCGTPLTAAPASEPAPAPTPTPTAGTPAKKPFKWGIVGVIALAAIAIAVVLILKGDPAKKAMKALENGDPETAYSIYKDKVLGSDKASEKLKESLLEYLSQIESDFESGKLTYEDAAQKLEDASELPVERSAQKRIRKEVDQLHQDMETLEAAKANVEGKKFPEAIRLFSSLIDSKSKYASEAGTLKKEAEDKYVEYLETQVKDLLGKKDFVTIDNLLSEARAYTDRNEIDTLYTDFISAVIKDRLTTVDEYISKDDYSNAIYTLENIYYGYFLYSERPAGEADLELVKQKYQDLYQSELKYIDETCASYASSKMYYSASLFLGKELDNIYYLMDPFYNLGIESTIQQDYNDLLLKQADFDTLNEQQEIADKIHEIETAKARNDYDEAFALLEEAESYKGEQVFAEARSNLLKDYEAYIRSTTIAAANAGEFTKAYNITTAAMKRVDSSELKELQKIFKSHINIPLGDMELFKDKSQGGDFGTSTYSKDEYNKDTYNNEYTRSVSVGSGYVGYLIDFKYSRLVATLACPKGTESDSYRYSATLIIYGNGTEIKRYSEITPDSKPQKIDIDISAYEKLYIQVQCDGMNIWHDWGWFATLFDAELVPIPLDIPEK